MKTCNSLSQPDSVNCGCSLTKNQCGDAGELSKEEPPSKVVAGLEDVKDVSNRAAGLQVPCCHSIIPHEEPAGESPHICCWNGERGECSTCGKKSPQKGNCPYCAKGKDCCYEHAGESPCDKCYLA